MKRMQVGLVSVLCLALLLSLAPNLSAVVTPGAGLVTLNVGGSADANGYTLKLVDISSGGYGSLPRASLQVFSFDGTLIRQVTFDTGSGEIQLVPEAGISVEPQEVFVGSEGQAAWVRLLVRISLPSPTAYATALPNVTSIPIPSPAAGIDYCSVRAFYGDGTWTLCVNAWVHADSGHYVKLVDISGYGYGTGADALPRASFVIYDSDWNKVGSLALAEGLGASDAGSGVSIFVEGISPGAFAREAWARVKISSVPKPTVTAVPAAFPPCVSSASGDGKHVLCVNSAWTNGRFTAKLEQVSGYGAVVCKKAPCPQEQPAATFGVYDGASVRVSQLAVKPKVGQYDPVSGIQVYAYEVSPGAYAQEGRVTALFQTLSTPPADNLCPDGSYGKVFQSGPTNDRSWTNLGLDTSSHPEILRYRIQWYAGSWSPWYAPGEGDVDWKLSSRRVWAYFEDHSFEFVACGNAIPTIIPVPTATAMPTAVPVGLSIAPSVNVGYDGTVEFYAKVYNDKGVLLGPQDGASVFVYYYPIYLNMVSKKAVDAVSATTAAIVGNSVESTAAQKPLSFASLNAVSSGSGSSGGGSYASPGEECSVNADGSTECHSTGGGGSGSSGGSVPVAIAVPTRIIANPIAGSIYKQMVQLKYYDGIWKGKVEGLSGYYQASFIAYAGGSYATASESFNVAGEEPQIPPFPSEGEDYKIRVESGWNMVSAPVYGYVYSTVSNDVISAPQVSSATVSTEGLRTLSFDAAGNQANSGPVPAAIAEKVAEIAIDMPTVRPAFGGAVISSTDCKSATLWYYDPAQGRYSNEGKLREGEVLTAGKAYWVRNQGGGCTAVVRGESRYSLYGRPLSSGWNQVGGLHDAISLDAIRGSCSIKSGPWLWDNSAKGYAKASTLEPGKGYFIKVAGSCTLGGALPSEEIPPFPEG